MERTLVIVNPAAAGGRSGRAWPRLAALLRELGLRFDALVTERPGQAETIAREAADSGHSLVVAVGGDGTVHEVVNGLLAARAKATLGIVSTGRGHDFGRILGLPGNAEEACRRLCGSGVREVDAVSVEYDAGGKRRSRCFVNAAGLGFEGEVAERARGGSVGGAAGYLWSLACMLWNFHGQAMVVSLDGCELNGTVSNVTIANGQYYGGGMHIAPWAELDDGLVDVVVLGDFGKMEVLWNLPRVYSGTHVTHSKVMMHRARQVEVRPQGRAILQADGEVLGEGPATFRVLPRALSIRV